MRRFPATARFRSSGTTSFPCGRASGASGNLSAHDAQYVALAEALNVPLVTADARTGRSGAARCAVEVFGAPK
jgi:hypothetical protein